MNAGHDLIAIQNVLLGCVTGRGSRMCLKSGMGRLIRSGSALGSALAEYRQSESGQAMVEYGLVIAIIAVIAISGLSFLGITVKMQLHHISQGLIKGY